MLGAERVLQARITVMTRVASGSSNPITPLAWALQGDTLHLLDKMQLQTLC